MRLFKFTNVNSITFISLKCHVNVDFRFSEETLVVISLLGHVCFSDIGWVIELLL
jgi:hypothetical protein